MANPWFRMYAEFAHDPKVQMMSEIMQRRYIMLMCMRCGNVTETLHETEIAFHLRISDADLAETKSLFIAKGFIDDCWNLLNWEKRQFVSDSSAARVARHRGNKKVKSNGDVTLQKRKCNALDTDTDTDIKTLSSKPDITPQSIEVIEYLNEKSGKNFQSTESHLRLIAARIKETDIDTLKAVVDLKVDEWRGGEMEKYLRPATLFNALKFGSYAGEVSGSNVPAWER